MQESYCKITAFMLHWHPEKTREVKRWRNNLLLKHGCLVVAVHGALLFSMLPEVGYGFRTLSFLCAEKEEGDKTPVWQQGIEVIGGMHNGTDSCYGSYILL